MCSLIGFISNLFYFKIHNFRFTVHNAVCYNAISGFWIIAATQFTTVLMACIILTFRAVFLEVEIEQADNVVRNEAGEEDEIKEVV